jgi:hypothetical protein
MNPAPVQYEYKLALDYKDVDPILFMSFNVLDSVLIGLCLISLIGYLSTGI